MNKPQKTPSVYAFIDSQNLNLGIQRMGWKMDWRKFRQFLYDTYNVTQAYMFIGYMAENEPLYEHMHELGYLIVLKPTVDIKPTVEADPVEHVEGQPNEETKQQASKVGIKGNIDADLVLYAMKELSHYDSAIIVSGDGDFYGLIEYLAEQKKLAYILTPNWQYSSLLKQFDNQIVRLDQLRHKLAYHDHKKKK
jgi:uncharacterized LabA/DUF88 family protein